MWVWFLVLAFILLIAFFIAYYYAGAAPWVWLLLALFFILLILALVLWWYRSPAPMVVETTRVVPAASLPAATPVTLTQPVVLPRSPSYRPITSIN